MATIPPLCQPLAGYIASLQQQIADLRRCELQQPLDAAVTETYIAQLQDGLYATQQSLYDCVWKHSAKSLREYLRSQRALPGHGVRWCCPEGPKTFSVRGLIAAAHLDSWLAAHRAVGKAIIWETSSGTQGYAAWNAAMKADLVKAFTLAWNSASFLPQDPVPNKKVLADTDLVAQVLDPAYAWPMFLAYVAQSLVVEIDNRVGWSVMDYSDAGLAQLFDSRCTFRWRGAEAGYEITQDLGVALPCAPNVSYRLLQNHTIGSNRFLTIANLLDWCRSHLAHFSGGWDTANVYDQWQYSGFPPVLKMIEGTPTLSQPSSRVWHRTFGCWGTTGFLRAVLRCVNVPVQLVTHCGHAQPNFIEDGLYLSHGDDPYDANTTSIPPMPIATILVDQGQFDAWFGPSVPSDSQCANLGRRPIDLSLTYLPTYLLHAYCRDIVNGKSHNDGEVYDGFKPLYTVAQLEALNLWGRMDQKIASLGGCSRVQQLPDTSTQD